MHPQTLSGGFFDPDSIKKQISELTELSQSSELWSDQKKAAEILKKKSQLESEIEKFEQIQSRRDDLVELLTLLDEEADADLGHEAEAEFEDLLEKVQKYKLECLLSGEADNNNAYLEVHAGAGGTEAQDWAQMLIRMYSRWADKRSYSVEIIEESVGEEAGIKSQTIRISGLKAYGWLKNESGVHRLVRISPFDANARRHTSFASVWVYPVVDDSIKIDINESDLRIDTYRASGAGGQHVNKTESAIRITHIPTGVAVQCQTDRSQHRNRAIAFEMLRSRLYELELRKREEAKNNEEKAEIGWGHQIRSYVLQPYQMVKDLRTGFEKGNALAVLEGDIDDFLQNRGDRGKD